MTIIQTFITASMTVERLKQNTIIAALSLAFAHKSGYKVKMYTDNLGKLILGRLPYDELNTELNNLKLPSSNALWSVGKYYALMKEPLKTIHTDFDVILKKPCLDGLFKDADMIAQIKEDIDNGQPWYEDCRQFLLTYGYQDTFDLSNPVSNAYNTGIIGYSNNEARDAHIKPILKVYNRFKDYKFKMPTLDFYIEQANLYNLSKQGFKVNTIIKGVNYMSTTYTIINTVADSIGYCHLQSNAKYSSEIMSKIIYLLRTQFKDIYNAIQDIIVITKI